MLLIYGHYHVNGCSLDVPFEEEDTKCNHTDERENYQLKEMVTNGFKLSKIYPKVCLKDQN